MNSYAYNLERDYDKVMVFLAETFDPEQKDSNWFPSRWEYMHYHPYFKREEAHKIQIWEHRDEIIAIAHYEMWPGEAYFEFRRGYEFLKEELFEYAYEHLCQTDASGKHKLVLFIYEDEKETEARLTDLAIRHSFEKTKWDQPRSVLDLSSKSLAYTLPEGFTIASLEKDDDYRKTAGVLWRGFNHEGVLPDGYSQERILMQSAPNFDKRLNIVVKNPDGEFVSYAGIWYEPSRNIAYVEPVATDPDYRRMGLGKAAVLESIKTVNRIYGADKAYVGANMPFYLSIGFEELYVNHAWVKEW